MFDITKIIARSGLVGFRGSSNPSYSISAANKLSRSGVYVEDVSKFVKIEYLRDCNEYYAISDNDFNAFLIKLQESAIIEVCNDVFSSEDILVNKPLYSGYADDFKEVENESDLVLYEFKLSEISNRSLIINKAWMYFNGLGTIKLLLFNQFKTAIVNSKSVSFLNAGMQEVELGWILPFAESNINGAWYVGYLTSGLSPKAYNCDRCKNNISGVYIESGKVSGWNTESIFNPKSITYTANEYGLNFDLSVAKDYTATFIANEKSFANAVAMSMAIKTIDYIRTANRSNINQKLSSEMVDKMIFEIEGNPELKIWGLRSRYHNAVKTLKRTFTLEQSVISIGDKL